MKTYNHLFEEITSFENLLAAARRAERGKRQQCSVGRFRTNIEAAEWRAACAAKLAECRLRLNERKSRAFPTTQGVTYLGQRIWRGRRRLCRQNVSDARRRLRWHTRQYKCGRLSRETLLTRWNSWRGHAEQADTGDLVERIRKELREILGATGN